MVVVEVRVPTILEVVVVVIQKVMIPTILEGVEMVVAIVVPVLVVLVVVASASRTLDRSNNDTPILQCNMNFA